MANHTITIINKGNSKRNSNNTTSNSTTMRLNKPTSSKTKFEKQKTNKPGFSFSKLIVNAAITYFSLKAVKQGVDNFANLAEAATGNNVRYSNLRSASRILTDPRALVDTLITQQFLGEITISRQNKALQYQRQLTGDLSYSRRFNNGTT